MDQLRKNENNYNNLHDSFIKLDEKVDRIESYLFDISRIAQFIDKSEDSPNPGHTAQFVKQNTPPTPENPGKGGIDSVCPSPTDQYNDMTVGLLGFRDVGSSEGTPSGVTAHVGHIAATHYLLQWPLVQELLAGKGLDENYVMKIEEAKGLLRIYGRGQGKDTYDGAQSGTPSSPMNLESGEDMDKRSSNASADDENWGNYDLGRPNIVDGKFFFNDKEHLGGLTAQGSLKLDQSTMIELMDSYFSNIHILHPFLDQDWLKRMVDKVCRNFNQDSTSYPPRLPVSTQNFSYAPHPRSSKRKHFSQDSNEPPLARRISTVIVLLVMALGKICLHSRPLPGFAGCTPKNTLGMMQHSSFPHALSLSSGFPSANASEMLGVFGSRGTLREGDRNVDVVPGLAYFARATDILGGLKGNDLSFAQAYLLAALYMAQLACVIESWTWIHHACRVCGFMIRDPIFRRERNRTRTDLIRLTYLTCLQLESDILAELELRPSELQTIDPEGEINLREDVTETPDILNKDNRSDLITVYYSYQLFLRKLMNDWQEFLYRPGGARPSVHDRNVCEKTLINFRHLIQKDPRIKWEDSDEPSSDINAARLRGKYYEAKCIIHRPFLYHVLHDVEEGALSQEIMKRFQEYERNSRKFPLRNQPAKITSREERSEWFVFQMLVSCQQYISAAKSSIIAFDGILKHKRLIVTNIFGTVHA